MTETVTVTAVYEEGVLRPVQRLNLREKQRVQIQILPQEPGESSEIDTEAEQENKRIIQSLVDAGILTPPTGQPDVEPMTESERRALAEEMGRMPGKPLSEIIIEDRGEW
jgi:predicted DNA-binding antitoxin AbrB/MazE fold protein